ncbi:filamentous hemagglutinin N-terminal domain-containing protein [Polaromonas sp. CG_9.11]|uniref:two-partner secretion domain-containing protein n=1 Tax=Polaromonas sp. CG_9.11 TaxID=2787730 RepID=UPI0018CBE013|nr:filamentous hemagglutinin N-terminal domain-containing protein [Polaromonas sp. CG_9.11]MBG6077857.1 filamentous hemagglutinin family protein [Polaromonas sp. CG_9.11]
MKSHASMNRIYRLVWNAALNLWVAVAENAKGRGKSGRAGASRAASAAAAAALALLAPQAWGADAANAAVTAGAGSISTAGAVTTINQASQRLAIDWTQLSTTASEALVFAQPNAQAIALNRITGSSPSSLLGSLTANGQVFLLNPNGVLFGAGAQVNAGGLVASTLSMGNADFLSGNHVFSKDASQTPGGTGVATTTSTRPGVVNQGTLNAAPGGYIALLAPEVRNEGTIAATLGTALMAAGNKITLNLNLNNGSVLGYSIDEGALKALAENRQLIQADGGQVILSARAADALSRATVNNTGIIEANTLQTIAGRIVLAADGGLLSSTGTLKAQGTRTGDKGGSIGISAGFTSLGGTVAADGVAQGGSVTVNTGGLSLSDQISATSAQGQGGSVSLSATGQSQEISGSRIDVSGAQGGSISHVAGGGVLSSGAYLAQGSAGSGGRIDISGYSVRLLSATADASGATDGGLVRLGGSFQGGKSPQAAPELLEGFVTRWGTAPTLVNAQKTLVNDSTFIDVSAQTGRAGTAIVWSDQQTTMVGNVRATGAQADGFVELSSARDLRQVSLPAVDIGSGHLLLDPQNIIIGDAATVSGWSYQAVLGKGYAPPANNNVGSLDGSDQFGTSVALNAAGNRLAVGAIGDDSNTNAVSNSGAVHLFSFTDNNFSGGTLQATVGKGYTGGKNIDVSSLEVNDNFGISVALNAAGDRLAVGAHNDDGNGNTATDIGAVRLFSFTDNSFAGGTLQATLGRGYTGGKNVDVGLLDAGDNFGYSVALNAAGDRLAVGARLDDGNGNTAVNSGAVHLFSFTDTSFTGGVLQATLGRGYTGGKNVDVSAFGNDDESGFGVALNAAGDRLAVGARYDDGVTNAVSNSGAVHLFSFTDNNFSGGALQATLGRGYTGGKNIDVTSLEVNDTFGNSVGLNAAGDRLAVGALGDDGNGNTFTNSGAVHLFSFTDNTFSGGTLQATLGRGYTGGKNVDVSSLDANDQFGISVALNATGDRLAVAANLDDGNGNAAGDSGAVHLFSFTDTSFAGGIQQATLGRGYVGGKNIDVRNFYSGDKSVNVGSLEGSDFFGFSVALNAAGDRLAVGAMGDDGYGNVATDSGAVRLYSFADNNFSGASLQATLGKGYSGGKNVDVTSLEAGDNFGSDVALNAAGDRLAVAARSDDGNDNLATDSGAVRLFSFTDNTFSGGTLQATLGRGYTGGKNIDVSSVQGSGGVALNAAGDRLAMESGSDGGNDNLAINSGAVRLFSFTDNTFSGGSLQATIGRGYTGGKNIDVSGLEAGDSFGGNVALNAAGDRLAVGAQGDDGFGNAVTDSGAARLFSFTDNTFGGGSLQATLGQGYTGGKNINISTLGGTDNFGIVALNAAGDRLAVAARRDDGNVNQTADSGAVYLFSFADTNFTSGTLEATVGRGYTGGKNIDVSSLDGGDRSGTSVALNAAGDRLAVGAIFDDGSGNTVSNSGAVYLYSFTDNTFNGGV